MKRTSAAAAALILSATAALAGSLTPGSEAIVSAVRANGDINAICHDRGRVTNEVKAATKSLVSSGRLPNNPRSDAMAAGRYILDNCGKF
ncbi:hypothetical protein [Acuticoccus mangrovi]|uniref:DUF732 domain-containing protein n=1 Tax=Acuticoccus mangrovi TaxID=2796142 RepID=A0A934IQ90_9HYPH|nr:hypothetical protein [Acuticoccus mangrovi]MBJ3776706.1 hypothetical protein [Acuticoccus mangrovi]